MMSTYVSCVCVLLFVFISVQSAPVVGNKNGTKQEKILVFTKTLAYSHPSIPSGVAGIRMLGKQNGFDVDSTNDSSLFTIDNLKQYSAVVFLSTTGDILNDQQQNAFINYIQSGKGFVGIHAAADAEYDWKWYNQLIGAYFMSHPGQQNATLNIVDQTFIATKHLPKQWKRFDEWFNFQSTQWEHCNILITIDETSYIGGEHGKYHPMSWYHDFDGGRSFYTELSHRDESYSNPMYLKHLLGGIQYAMFGIKT